MNKKIALVGASSVGKTTIYELLKTKLPGYDFKNESTRTIANYGFPINEKGTSETQLAISSFHLEALLTTKDTVYDRCYLDLIVYSSYIESISPQAFKYIEDTWTRVRSYYTHFIYFPIEFKSVDDGVRSVNEEWRHEVDQLFQSMLIKGGIDYLKITGSPNERVKQILNYIQ